MVHYDNPYGVVFPSRTLAEYRAEMDKDGPDKWVAGVQDFFNPVLISLKQEMTSKEEEW